MRKDPPAVKRVVEVSPPAVDDLDVNNASAEPLFEHLRRLRLQMARENGLPPYIVFHDKTLREMAALKPGNREEFLMITGVGELKAEKYGECFLKAIREFDGS